ncbi:MAG: UDP-N-acetylglucosamine 1-carboxyvinyltransferase, partial [Dongiaceae bacterium]
MDKIRIRGGKRLQGRIRISGAKNAALPVMAAALLTDQPVDLSNVPELVDIATMAGLLTQLGTTIEESRQDEGQFSVRTLRLRTREIVDSTASYDLVRKMRASVLVLGPLVARFGRA